MNKEVTERIIFKNEGKGVCLVYIIKRGKDTNFEPKVNLNFVLYRRRGYFNSILNIVIVVY